MRRSHLIGASLVLVLVAVGAAVWLSGGPAESVRVERGDLVIGVGVTGTLRAVESSSLGPPQIRNVWQYKIAMMADEGSEVTAGQPILAFDPSELQQRLQTKQADLDAARKEVEKKQVDIAVSVAADTLAYAEVEAKLRKARFLSVRPPGLHSSIDVEKASLDLELAELEVDLIRRRIDATRRAGEEEFGVLEATLVQVETEVRQLRDAIGRMTRVAPRDGIVIHVSNWRRERKKVGDSCWIAEQVLEIPDLSRMEADAEVEEAHAGRIREGQMVTIRLDAHPDHEYRGTVESIARTVQEKSWRNPLKVVNLTLSLDETDPERMRPGMRFRGEIEIGRRENVTLLPIATVFRDEGSIVAYRKRIAGWHRVKLVLGDHNIDQVEVLEGLEPGDTVSLEPVP